MHLQANRERKPKNPHKDAIEEVQEKDNCLGGIGGQRNRARTRENAEEKARVRRDVQERRHRTAGRPQGQGKGCAAVRGFFGGTNRCLVTSKDWKRTSSSALKCKSRSLQTSPFRESTAG